MMVRVNCEGGHEVYGHDTHLLVQFAPFRGELDTGVDLLVSLHAEGGNDCLASEAKMGVPRKRSDDTSYHAIRKKAHSE
jgi:hypothetical protein